jgi:hypothetical protein
MSRGRSQLRGLDMSLTWTRRCWPGVQGSRVTESPSIRIRRIRRAIGLISMTVPTVARNPGRRPREPGAAAAPVLGVEEVATKKRYIATCWQSQDASRQGRRLDPADATDQGMKRCRYRLMVIMASSLTRPSCRPARSRDIARTCSVMAYETCLKPV